MMFHGRPRGHRTLAPYGGRFRPAVHEGPVLQPVYGNVNPQAAYVGYARYTGY